MNTIGERIAFVRGQVSRKDFASSLGIPANTLRNYESGISLPNSDFIAKICTDLNINPYWLLFGLSHGVEYPINADEGLIGIRKANQNYPKSGDYVTISTRLDLFKYRTSHEFVSVLKRNMQLYSKVHFIYYKKEEKTQISSGYKVAALGSIDGEKYDLYHAKDMDTKSDFFVPEFVGILSAAYKYNVAIFELYASESTIESITATLKGGDGEISKNDYADTEILFLSDEPVHIPTILYGFCEVDPPEDDSDENGSEGSNDVL